MVEENKDKKVIFYDTISIEKYMNNDLVVEQTQGNPLIKFIIRKIPKSERLLDLQKSIITEEQNMFIMDLLYLILIGNCC